MVRYSKRNYSAAHPQPSPRIFVTGSAAVLIKAKKSRVVRKLKPLLEQPGEHGYRMSDVLIAEILNRVNETSD